VVALQQFPVPEREPAAGLRGAGQEAVNGAQVVNVGFAQRPAQVFFFALHAVHHVEVVHDGECGHYPPLAEQHQAAEQNEIAAEVHRVPHDCVWAVECQRAALVQRCEAPELNRLAKHRHQESRQQPGGVHVPDDRGDDRDAEQHAAPDQDLAQRGVVEQAMDGIEHGILPGVNSSRSACQSRSLPVRRAPIYPRNTHKGRNTFMRASAAARSGPSVSGLRLAQCL
jgi:hypothetical protein